MAGDDVFDAARVRARNKKLSELFGSNADPRVAEAVRLRAHLLSAGIPRGKITLMVATTMGMHRNTVYGYWKTARTNRAKYKWQE